ncbi:unnamed protein product, partial [Sphacelaria rigidula]
MTPPDRPPHMTALLSTLFHCCSARAAPPADLPLIAVAMTRTRRDGSSAACLCGEPLPTVPPRAASPRRWTVPEDLALLYTTRIGDRHLREAHGQSPPVPS